MAATPEAALLNKAYTGIQGRAAASGAIDVITAMREHLDPLDLDGTFARYLASATPLIQGKHASARLLGAAYYQAHRTMEKAPGSATVVLARDLAPRQVMSSLLTTGPVAMKVSMRGGATLAQAVAVAESLTSGAAFRLVANGARETVAESLRADARVQRWQRVTDGNACEFCDMLAGRGAVYITEDTAVGSDFHDRCGCYAEGVYS
jgi:hypothetical protein